MSNFIKLPPILPKQYLREQINTLMEKGLPSGYYTGIKVLDDICRIDKGRLVTVTGIPNLGKSEFVDFITTTLNKRYGLKTLFYSPENMPVAFHLEKIIRKYTLKPISELSGDEKEKAINYVLDNFYFFNGMDVTQLPTILKEAETMVREKNVDILVIDPYNRIDVDKNALDIETQYISKILNDLCRLAQRCNIIVFLVAHPRKMTKDSCGRYIKPTGYDINGSANFNNKTDFGFTVHREQGETKTNITAWKVKFSNYGTCGECDLEYDTVSGNYYEASSAFNDDDLPFFDLDFDTNKTSSVTPKTPLSPFVFPEIKQDKSPLDVKVSVYEGTIDNTGKEMVLKDFLLTDAYKDVAEDIRKGATPEERHDRKDRHKKNIPCVTPSGLFSKRGVNNLIKHSGLLCIDIDRGDNVEVMDRVPTILRRLPYVAYAAKSITGDGYYAIVPIEHPEHHREHFLAIEKEFKDEYGIVLDKSCKDVSRMRFATYDAEAYYNPQASTYYQEIVETLNTEQPFVTTQTAPFKLEYSSTPSVADLDAKIREAVKRGINIVDPYEDWRKMGMSLATLGEEGRERFHAVSSTSPKYDRDECDAFFTNLLATYPDEKNEYTLRTAFKILNTALHQ